MTITLLALSMTAAQANTPTVAPIAIAPSCVCVVPYVRPTVELDVPTRTITFDPAQINRFGFGDDLNDTFALVPGHNRRTNTLADYGARDVAVMLDGVLLRNEGRLAPLP